MQGLSTTPAQEGLTWLEKQSSQARASQLQVFVVRLCQLVSQITAFWFFSDVVQLMVVKQTTVQFEQVTPFILAASTWALCVWLSDFLSYNAKLKIEGALEGQVHKVLQSQQVSITRKYSSTYWQQLLLTNLSDIGDFLTQYSIQKWLAGVGPLVVVLVILPVNYVVAFTLLVTMPVVPIFMILVGKGAATRHRKHFLALERLGDMFSDRLKGLSLITATGQHQNQICRLTNASSIVNRKAMDVVALAFLSTTVLDFFSTVSIALNAVFIGFSMLGELTFGPSIGLHQGLFMLLVAPLLFAELRMLGKLYHQKAKAQAGAERFGEIFRVPCKENDSAQTGDVNWKNFQINEPRQHASEITIRKGDWILLSGVSGSGKTSILEALIGFRSASHSLGGNISLLSQHSTVLDDTLAFNLHLGHGNFSSSELVRSLVEVGMKGWFESLPNGLTTQLGDSPPLSGGVLRRARMENHPLTWMLN